MIKVAFAFIRNTSILWLWIIPTVFWLLGGSILIGLPPSVVKKNNLERIQPTSLFQVNFSRVITYKWELLFTAIHLGTLTGILFVLEGVGSRLLSNYPEIVFPYLGFFGLFIIFYGKIKSIWSRPPSRSVLSGFRYLYSGYVNPFRSVEVYSLDNDEGERNA